MDKIIEELLTDFVIKTSERFNLSFEDALAAVSQSKVANDIVATGIPDSRSQEDLCNELLNEVSIGY